MLGDCEQSKSEGSIEDESKQRTGRGEGKGEGRLHLL